MKEKVTYYIKAKYNNQDIDEKLVDNIDLAEPKKNVIDEIKKDVLDELGFGEERFEIVTGIEIDELIKLIFPILEV